MVQNLWDAAKTVLEGSNTNLLWEARTDSKKQPNITPKELEKERQTKPKSSEGR